MAIVTFTVDGVEHFADEDSRAYELYKRGIDGGAELEQKVTETTPAVSAKPDAKAPFVSAKPKSED